MLARPTRRATYQRGIERPNNLRLLLTALESGELISQNEKVLRHSEGSGMLKVNLYGEGSNASSIRRSEWSGMLIGDPLWRGEQC